MHGAHKHVLSPSKANNINTPPKRFKKHIELETKQEPAADRENYDFLFGDDNDFDFDALQLQTPTKLDLSSWQRCVVQQVERERRTCDQVLHLRAESCADDATPPTAICRLQGPWVQTQVQAGDLLSVQAHWQPELGCYVVNKDQGYCVSHPDMLISGTTVTGSLFCRRKAVLQERFRGVDAGSHIMVIGSLVHELLQTVLAQRLRSSADVEAEVQRMVHSQAMARTLYEAQMTRDQAWLELEKFVGPVVSFIEQYVDGVQPDVLPPDMYRGCIEQIQDIEENLWVPQLGLKGKVDVSVRVRSRHQSKQAAANAPPIPLELKTGRASFSMEHKGQLLLYQLMQTALGQETSSGLLLYLREGILREVRAARNEQRDLVVLRNDLAHYLSREAQLPEQGAPLALAGPAGKLLQPFELPEPISHHSACGNCAYATVCCSFAATDAQLQLRDGHPLRPVMAQATQHLQGPDYEYFMRWCGLLALEEQEVRRSQNLRALWTLPAAKRQQQGRAVCDLRLRAGSEVRVANSRYVHTLQLDADVVHDVDLTLSGFDLGEYVIVSSRQRLAIAAGFISALGPDSVCLELERDLRQNYADAHFIMDKHESQSFNVFNYTNLGLLLENSERAARLRSVVVARTPPTCHKVLSKVVCTKGAPILAPLNSVQRAAALRALTSSHLLIKGLPGTGKTQTLVAIVRLLHLLGRSVLITSQTHSAVDNLLLRLQPHKLPLLRLGASARIHAQLQECSEQTLTRNCNTEAQLADVFNARPIVGVTCLGAAHALFLHRQFDYCIVDEATQVLQPTVLRPLWHCSRFILVGDPDQLPPVIRSREARQRGADESLFQRLDSEAATAVLSLQYRMNRTITKLANSLTYDGALRCAGPEVETATLQLEPLPAEAAKWLLRALQTHLEQAVLLLDTQDCAERSQAYAAASKRLGDTCAAIEQHYGAELAAEAAQRSTRISKYTNYCEAAVVFRLVHQLLGAGCEAARIGVIAPYRAQVELLRKLALGDVACVEFNTVDQYQGRDKDVIIYSCTKTGAAAAPEAAARSRESEILEDQRRLTVAITRAKRKLIVLGDVQCLRRYAPFRQLFEHIPAHCRLQLADGRMGFTWQTLLAELIHQD